MGGFTRVAIALVAPLLIIASAYSWSNGVSRGQQPREEVATPEQWVPFTAKVQRLRPGVASDVVGRLYRASDGSRRLESGPPGNRQAVISINNYSQLKTYMYAEKIGWSTKPLLLQNALRPPKMSVDNIKLFRHPEKIENLEVLRHTDPGGETSFLAPALNGETILRQGINGYREVLSEIVVGEQPIELFEPPPGAVMGEPIDFNRFRHQPLK